MNIFIIRRTKNTHTKKKSLEDSKTEHIIQVDIGKYQVKIDLQHNEKIGLN